MKLVTVTRNCAKCIAAAFVAVACTAQEPLDTQAPNSSEPAASSALVPGQATIQFTPDMAAFIEEGLQSEGAVTKSADLNAILSELGAVSLKRVFPDAGPFEGRTRRAGLHCFYKVVFSDKAPLTKAVTELSQMPGIVSVTPHHKIEKRVSFNDPWFHYQWHYVSDDGKADINVKGVWDKYTKGSSKVIVSVVDEAVDASHPDLQSNLWKDELGHTGYNFARDSWDMSLHPEGVFEKGEWYNGDIGHGTHVAGTIAAVNNNNIGLCGIAGGDYANNIYGVRLQSSAIFSGNVYADDDQTANAIKWGADHGAVISQNSWGYNYDEEAGIDAWMQCNIENSCPQVKAAVDYFIQYAGCDDDGNQLPDSPMKGGLVIFAGGNDNVKWDIISTYPPIIAVGAYTTSLSHAFYSNYGDWVDVAAPGGEAGKKETCIWSTVPQKVNDGDENGGKVITTDLYEGIYWQGTSMACPHVSGVAALIVSYFGGPGFTANAAKEILFAGLGETLGGSKPVGKKLDALSSFEYGVKHYPAGGSGATDPQAPVLTLDQTEVTVKAHEQVKIGFTVYDPNGDTVSMMLYCPDGTHALSLDQGNSCLVIDGWKDDPGTYSATLVARDATLFTQEKLTYTILPNHAPKVKGSVADMLLSGLQKVGSVPLENLFEDEDGETLSINAVSSDETCVKAFVEGDRVVVSPMGFGSATITMTATDFMGEDATLSFKVAVVDPDQPVHVTTDVVSTDAYIGIETETEVSVKVSVYSSTGALVLQTQMQASAFNPIHLDVSELAPGRYTAVLEYNGVTRKVRVIKY